MNVQAKHGKLKKVNVINRTLALQPLEVPVRDATRGIIPIKDLAADVEVLIPRVAEMKRQDSVELYRDGVKFGQTYRLRDLGFDDPLILKFSVPFKIADFPAVGSNITYNLDYRVFDPISGKGDLSNLPLRVRFDRQMAGGGRLPPIFFTRDQLTGITEVDMVNDQLPVMIDPYHLGEAEDTVQLSVSTTEAEDPQSYLSPPFTVVDPTIPLSVHFTRDQLTTLTTSGTLYFGYRVTDWAGNVSALSHTVGISVFLDQPDLEAPLVPAGDDGLVTFNEVAPFVEVQIPTYASGIPAAGDTIYLYWGAGPAVVYSLQAADLGNDPLTTIKVPYATVAAQAPGDVIVRYEMRRGEEPSVPSPPTTVQVNLETPGGPDPDPDPETPVHELIRPPEIRCGTSPLNSILPGDFGKDAVATIKRPRVGDNEPIWKINDVIQVFWATISDPIPSKRVVVANEPSDITVDIPFTDVIETIGTGKPKVYFTLTRELDVAGGGKVPVTARSPDTEVTVSAGSELPGGGDPLEKGEFPEAIDYEESAGEVYRLINALNAGQNESTFRIPLAGVVNIEFERRPRVSYKFTGYATGDEVKPPAKPWTPLPNAVLEGLDVPLTQAELAQGYFEVILPYAGLLQRICRNGAELTYSLVNDLEIPVQGPEAYVYIALNDGGGSCPLFLSRVSPKVAGPLEPLTVPVLDASGIIPVEFLKEDVVIRVPKHETMTNVHEIHLLRDGLEFGSALSLEGLDLSDPEVRHFELTYETKDFPREGDDQTVALDYLLFDTIAQTETRADRPVQVRIDRRAPGGGFLTTLGFTLEQLTGITDADLVDDKLIVKLYPYLYGERGDKVELWLGKSENPDRGTYLGTSLVIDNPLIDHEVHFTRAQLENGLLYFGYRIKDHAGNYSSLSRLMDIEVDITPARSTSGSAQPHCCCCRCRRR